MRTHKGNFVDMRSLFEFVERASYWSAQKVVGLEQWGFFADSKKYSWQEYGDTWQYGTCKQMYLSRADMENMASFRLAVNTMNTFDVEKIATEKLAHELIRGTTDINSIDISKYLGFANEHKASLSSEISKCREAMRSLRNTVRRLRSSDSSESSSSGSSMGESTSVVQ